MSIVPEGFRLTSHKVFSQFTPPVFESPSSSSVSSNRKRHLSPVQVLIPVPVIECAVCLSGFEDPVTLVKCHHSFCFQCLTQWFKKSNKCPLCKRRCTSFIRETPKLTTQEDFTDNEYHVSIYQRPVTTSKCADEGNTGDDKCIEAISVHKKRFSTYSEDSIKPQCHTKRSKS